MEVGDVDYCFPCINRAIISKPASATAWAEQKLGAHKEESASLSSVTQ